MPLHPKTPSYLAWFQSRLAKCSWTCFIIRSLKKTMDNMDIPVSLTRSVHPVSFDPASSCVPGYRDVYTHTYTRTSIICAAVRCNGLNPRRGLSFYWHGFTAIYHIILYTISAFQLKKNFQLNPTHHLSNKLYSYLFKQHHTSCGCSQFTSWMTCKILTGLPHANYPAYYYVTY